MTVYYVCAESSCHCRMFVDIRKEIALIEEKKLDVEINPLKVCLQYFSCYSIFINSCNKDVLNLRSIFTLQVIDKAVFIKAKS